MAASASEERFRPSFQLKIKTIQEKDSFFRSIFLRFIDCVHPVESGLLDALYASSTLTNSDIESINEDSPTRRDKARKLHHCLKKLPLNVLLTNVGPLLCSKYPHLIPMEFQGNLEEEIIVEYDGLDQDCLRCGIQERIVPKIIADLLYAHRCFPDATYWKIQNGGCHHEGDWEKLFQAFRDVPDELNENLSKEMKIVLQGHHFRIPENLNQIMALGFPCECAGAENSIQTMLAERKIHEEGDMFSHAFERKRFWLLARKSNEEGDMFSLAIQNLREISRKVHEEFRRELERSEREGGYFYYCSKERMMSVKRTGIIQDFSYSGESVTLTTLSPAEGKEAIAKNMFGSNWRTKMKNGEVDYAICVQLPKDLLKNCSFGDRKLFKHRGPLDLKNYEWKIVKVS